MIKYQILKILENNNDLPICDDCIALNQNFSRIQSNKRCSILYKDSLIDVVKGFCHSCNKSKTTRLITDLGRMTLCKHENKGELIEDLETENNNVFDFLFKYEWIPVVDCEINYCFPSNISKKRNSKNHRPAIYRWIISNLHGEKTKNIYIGEATNLSDRMYQYVNANPSQKTNIRLNEKFSELLEKGYTIHMEELIFEPFYFENNLINEKSLKNKYIRRFLEHLLISYYDLKGYNLLNN